MPQLPWLTCGFDGPPPRGGIRNRPRANVSGVRSGPAMWKPATSQAAGGAISAYWLGAGGIVPSPKYQRYSVTASCRSWSVGAASCEMP